MTLPSAVSGDGNVDCRGIVDRIYAARRAMAFRLTHAEDGMQQRALGVDGAVEGQNPMVGQRRCN